MRKIAAALPLVVGLGLFSGCEAEPPAAPPAPAAPEPAAPEAAAAPTHGACVGPIAAGTPENITVAGHTWVRNGSTLKLEGGKAEEPLSIGVITDIKEDSPENLANLKDITGWFKAQGAGLVVVAGDTGLDKGQIENALGVVAESGLPVLNIIGNREGLAQYNAALAAVSAKHANVFDLNVIRRVDLPQIDIVSMPGYHNPNYIHADDGCAYTAQDVAGLADLVKASDSPVLLVSHGGPKQAGPEAIDRTAEGENAGDPALASLIKQLNIPFGVFGNIHEAGGRATDLEGSKVLAQNEPHDHMYLNPGPADAVRWVMNDKTESVGMAGLVKFAGGKASYAIHRIGAGAEAKAPGKGKAKGKKGG